MSETPEDLRSMGRKGSWLSLSCRGRNRGSDFGVKKGVTSKSRFW